MAKTYDEMTPEERRAVRDEEWLKRKAKKEKSKKDDKDKK